jgi:hypothetical protein
LKPGGALTAIKVFITSNSNSKKHSPLAINTAAFGRVLVMFVAGWLFAMGRVIEITSKPPPPHTHNGHLNPDLGSANLLAGGGGTHKKRRIQGARGERAHQ